MMATPVRAIVLAPMIANPRIPMWFVMFTKVAPAVCVMVRTSVPVMPRMPPIIPVIVITARLCLTWEDSKYRERGGKRRRPA